MSEDQCADNLSLFVVNFDLCLKIVLELLKERHLSCMEGSHFSDVLTWLIVSIRAADTVGKCPNVGLVSLPSMRTIGCLSNHAFNVGEYLLRRERCTCGFGDLLEILTSKLLANHIECRTNSR